MYPLKLANTLLTRKQRLAQLQPRQLFLNGYDFSALAEKWCSSSLVSIEWEHLRSRMHAAPYLRKLLQVIQSLRWITQLLQSFLSVISTTGRKPARPWLLQGSI
jgi:hypothetical protein